MEHLENNVIVRTVARVLNTNERLIVLLFASYSAYIYWWVYSPMRDSIFKILSNPTAEGAKEGANAIASIITNVIDDMQKHPDEYVICLQQMGMKPGELATYLSGQVSGKMLLGLEELHKKVDRDTSKALEKITPKIVKHLTQLFIKNLGTVSSKSETESTALAISDIENIISPNDEIEPVFDIESYYMNENLPRPPDLSLSCKLMPSFFLESWIEDCDKNKIEIEAYKETYGLAAYNCPNIYNRFAVEVNTAFTKIVGSVNLQVDKSIKLAELERRQGLAKAYSATYSLFFVIVIIFIFNQIYRSIFRRNIRRGENRALMNFKKTSRRKVSK
jgi:hypothetical protein